VTAIPNVEPVAASAGGPAAATAPLRVADAAQPARIVDPRGRFKVFRPLPAAEREAALDRGLAAYARGDFYLAHEELEPAWMGTDDPGERELLAGLIKLAAAFVHVRRGNPAGAATNLRGARVRLEGAAAAGQDGGFDIPALLSAIGDRLARLALLTDEPADKALDADVALVLDPPHDVAGPSGRARRPPLVLGPPTIARRMGA